MQLPQSLSSLAGPRCATSAAVAPLAALTLAATCLTGCADPQPETSVETPRSIILVDIDTLRADHLGCYGYPRPTSPSIDALAAESIRFEWAFSQGPNTPPSQASLLTGLYPTSHGLILAEDRLDEEVTTLAETLSAADFVTAGFVDGGFMSAEFGLGEGFGLYHNNRGRGLAGMGPAVFRWLEEHAEERFLLLVHTYDVHTPYAPPEPYRSMFLDGLEPPTPGFEPDVEQMEAIRTSQWSDEPKTLPAHDLAYAKARYDGGIRYVDQWVGELMAHLQRLGLDRTTLVVLFSDHGEEFQEHGSVLHEKLYATVTRIPLLMRFPGGAPRGVVSTLVEGVDLTPTVLDAVGVPAPPTLHGESLLPLIHGGRTPGRALAFGESPYFGKQRFVAHGDYRLLVTLENGREELYDYRSDPLEQVDLADVHAQEVTRLRSALTGWERLVGRKPVNGADGAMSAETREQLRALGYLR